MGYYSRSQQTSVNRVNNERGYDCIRSEDRSLTGTTDGVDSQRTSYSLCESHKGEHIVIRRRRHRIELQKQQMASQKKAVFGIGNFIKWQSSGRREISGTVISGSLANSFLMSLEKMSLTFSKKKKKGATAGQMFLKGLWATRILWFREEKAYQLQRRNVQGQRCPKNTNQKLEKISKDCLDSRLLRSATILPSSSPLLQCQWMRHNRRLNVHGLTSVYSYYKEALLNVSPPLR